MLSIVEPTNRTSSCGRCNVYRISGKIPKLQNTIKTRFFPYYRSYYICYSCAVEFLNDYRVSDENLKTLEKYIEMVKTNYKEYIVAESL